MHYLKLQFQYGGDIIETIFTTPSNDPTIGELQQHIEKQLHVPVDAQWLLFKGQNLHEQPASRLRQYGIANTSRIRVVGRNQPKAALL